MQKMQMQRKVWGRFVLPAACTLYVIYVIQERFAWHEIRKLELVEKKKCSGQKKVDTCA